MDFEMRRTNHIALTIGIRVFALMLVALPALAQPPDTLLLTPCQLASLSSVVDLSPSALWVRGDYYERVIEPRDLRTLDTIGMTVAPEPLPKFTSNATAIARNANNPELFRRQIYSRYPQYDPEISFDTALLGRAFLIARRIVNGPTSNTQIFIAPRRRAPNDSVAILISSTPIFYYDDSHPPPYLYRLPRTFIVDSLRILDDPDGSIVGSGTRMRKTYIINETIEPSYAAADAAGIARWMKKSRLGDARVHRLPIRKVLSDLFERRHNRSIHEIWQLRIGRDLVDHDVEYFWGWGSDIFRLLDAFGADTIITRARVEDIILTLYCNDSESAEATVPYDASDSLLFSFDEFDDTDTTPYDCAKEFNFSDTTRWNAFADSISSLLPHYLAFPDRVYAVVAGDTVRTFLAFANDTSRATPVVITRDELEAMPALKGTDWWERLMRSIREEECWAERVEGY